MAHDDETSAAEPPVPSALPAPLPGEDGGEQSRVAQELLAEHVPLALLVDLVAPVVSSEEILEAEGLPDEPWWEPEAGHPSQ